MAYLTKISEAKMKGGNGPEVFLKIGSRWKPEGSLNQKYLGIGYAVKLKIHPGQTEEPKNLLN